MARKRILMTIVSVFLVICLLVNCFPIRAKASAAVGSAAIVKASLASCNPYIIVGGVIIALGVMIGVESGAFETLVDNAVNYLDSLGGWIQDGYMQILKTTSDSGVVSYYADTALFETLRTWMYDTGVVTAPLSMSNNWTVSFEGNSYTVSSDVPFTLAAFRDNFSGTYMNYWLVAFSSYSGSVTIYNSSGNKIDTKSMSSSSAANLLLSSRSYKSGQFYDTSVPVYDYWWYGNLPSINGSSELDLSLGVLSNTAIDGEIYDDAYADYMRKQLRVYQGSGSDDNDDNKSTYLPLVLSSSADVTYATTQAQQWTGDVIDDSVEDEIITEYDVVSTYDSDGVQDVVLSPSVPFSDVSVGSFIQNLINALWTPITWLGDKVEAITEFFTFSTDISDYPVDLTSYFPFCIPWDIYNFLSLFLAEPEAPHFEFDVPFPYMEDNWHIEVDLSSWDSVASLARTLELILFIVGLAFVTREKFLRG